MVFIKRHSYWSLILLMVSETLFLFYLNQVGLPHVLNSLLYFTSSVAFGLALLARFYGREVEIITHSPISQKRMIVILLFAIFLLAFCLYKVNDIISSTIASQTSDVIPQIEIAVTRFLSGQGPYETPIHVQDHDMPLTYLPMHWLPYTVSVFFRFDTRWVTFGIWLVSVLLLSIRNYRNENLTPLFCLGLLAYILYRNPDMLSNTVELMVAGFYILLIIGMGQRNALLQGLAIGICLLSRFSLVLWLPLFGYVLLLARRKRELIITLLTAIVFVVGLYIVPFLSKDWESFGRAYNYYDQAICLEWKNGTEPFHLHRGVGFAYYFFHFVEGAIESKVHLLKKVHLAICIVVPVLLGLWYWRHKDRIHHKVFIMASFKIYLAFFLAFIQLPYEYLMIVANFVSIAIFSEQARYRLKNL